MAISAGLIPGRGCPRKLTGDGAGCPTKGPELSLTQGHCQGREPIVLRWTPRGLAGHLPGPEQDPQNPLS